MELLLGTFSVLVKIVDFPVDWAHNLRKFVDFGEKISQKIKNFAKKNLKNGRRDRKETQNS